VQDQTCFSDFILNLQENTMILLKFEPELKGDSKTDKHDGWITIDSMQWGVGRAISSSGVGTDRDTSNPSFSEISISKSMDVASAQLMLEAACGKSLDKATFHFIQTGGKDSTGQHYLEIVLEKPILSSYSQSSGGERPSESISINYVGITMQYDQFEEGKTPKKGEAKGYDLKANKPKNKI
jgi:type VI secretion system secreted protein Hcp